MSNPHFHMDELEATGNKIRVKNKLKARNLMALSASFIDPGTLAKIQRVFLELSPEAMAEFKHFLNQRQYLSPTGQKSSAQKVLNRLVALALRSIPEDPGIREILEEYYINLERIDALKIETTTAQDIYELTPLFLEIELLNTRNVQLFQAINRGDPILLEKK